MSYTPQTWVDNDPTKPLSAARLAYIETGIQNANALGSSVSPAIANAALIVNSGATNWVEQLITTASFDPSVFATGVEGSIPSASAVAVGSEYYATDTFVLFRSTGAVWVPISWPGWRGTLAGALSSCDLSQVSTATIVLAASGTDTLTGVFIPMGFVVSNIFWKSGTTAATLGSNNDSHWYSVIRNQAGGLMASTADQTTSAIAANTAFTKAIARNSTNGAASTWTSPASDTYLVGPNIYLGTGGAPVMPTGTGSAALTTSAINNLRKIISATGQTAMTSGTPATTSTPANASVMPFTMVF